MQLYLECKTKRTVLVMMRAAPFLLKTYMVVDDPTTNAVISWNDEGTTFVVRQPAEFARDLLPTLFKHSNFSSFVRQLNTYGFRKVATNRWEFSNDMFRRGKRDELCNIFRRKSPSNKPNPNVKVGMEHSATSASDENKRLRQENGMLIYELNLMKKKYSQLLSLVSVYGARGEEDSNGAGLKLFGVTLEVGDHQTLQKNRAKTR